jgi:hypothetical protein
MLARAVPRAILRSTKSTSSTVTASLTRASFTRTTNTATTTRALSTTRPLRAAASHDDHHGGGHDSHYDPPGGWLWGVPPGEKRKSEGWEWPAVLYCVSIVVAVVAYTMKEDTS